jgi:hypothetical protein
MKEVAIRKGSLRQVDYTHKTKILGFPLRNVYIEIIVFVFL